MITLERISQDLHDLLLEINVVDPDTYGYNELKALIIELKEGDRSV